MSRSSLSVHGLLSPFKLPVCILQHSVDPLVAVGRVMNYEDGGLDLGAHLAVKVCNPSVESMRVLHSLHSRGWSVRVGIR